MAYVRRRGNQLAIVQGERDPQTRKVQQRILFTLYSKPEALEALGKRGDVAIGISTSGNSPNVLRALETANERGLVTVALTGRGGAAGTTAAHHIAVPEERTARVQEVHATLLHVICELVEKELNG